MRNRILGLAAIAAAIGAPIAAQAQSTVGVVRGESVIVDNGDGIAVEQRPAFREYVVRERVPTYTIPDRVIVGGVLPEAGITYLRRAADLRRHAVSLHRRERPDRAGRTAHPSRRSGDRLDRLNDDAPRRAAIATERQEPRPGHPRRAGLFLSCRPARSRAGPITTVVCWYEFGAASALTPSASLTTECMGPRVREDDAECVSRALRKFLEFKFQTATRFASSRRRASWAFS